MPPTCSDGTAATASARLRPSSITCAAKLQVQRPEPAPGQPLDPRVGAGMRHCRSRRAGCRAPARAEVHAGRVVRMVGDVRVGAQRSRPRRRGRDQREEREPDERQRDEAQCPAIEVAPAAQPQHRGRHVRQEEERDVAERDEDVPPLHVAVLEVLLQPHRRLGAEEQELVDVDLRVPPGRHAGRVGPARATGRTRSAPARTAGSRRSSSGCCACRCSRRRGRSPATAADPCASTGCRPGRCPTPNAAAQTSDGAPAHATHDVVGEPASAAAVRSRAIARVRFAPHRRARRRAGSRMPLGRSSASASSGVACSFTS